MKLLLEAWAAQQFAKPPSLYTLRRMARDGEITPAPIKVGRSWYVDQAARLTVDVPARPSIVDRLRGR